MFLFFICLLSGHDVWPTLAVTAESAPNLSRFILAGAVVEVHQPCLTRADVSEH